MQIGTLLDFQRNQALNWLRDELKKTPKATDLDKAIDCAVRTAAGLPDGGLYGFVRPPKPEPKGEIKLPIHYYNQVDNYRDGKRTCFSSTCAMMLEFYKPDAIANDNEYVKRVFDRGDTTDPNVQVSVLKSYGLKPTYRQNMGFDDLDENLEAGHPVAIAILHRGHPDNPTGGHWLLVGGRAADEEAYICYDPYGSLGDGYQGAVENGNGVEYSKRMLRKRWTVEGPGSGWGMIARI